MTPQETLDQFRDVVVANANQILLEISLDLRNKSLEEQRKAFAGEKAHGFFYLHRMDKHPEFVFECLVSPYGDAISSLYMNHRIFNSPGELMRARAVLCKAVAEKVGLSVEGVGVDDAARGRTLGLSDLSTGQLIDMLAERMGQSIVTTDSHTIAAMPKGE